MMSPDDANYHGNVHGGVILRMIEEAGVIISTRHCNSQNEDTVSGSNFKCYVHLSKVKKLK